MYVIGTILCCLSCKLRATSRIGQTKVSGSSPMTWADRLYVCTYIQLLILATSSLIMNGRIYYQPKKKKNKRGHWKVQYMKIGLFLFSHRSIKLHFFFGSFRVVGQT